MSKTDLSEDQVRDAIRATEENRRRELQTARNEVARLTRCLHEAEEQLREERERREWAAQQAAVEAKRQGERVRELREQLRLRGAALQECQQEIRQLQQRLREAQEQQAPELKEELRRAERARDFATLERDQLLGWSEG